MYKKYKKKIKITCNPTPSVCVHEIDIIFALMIHHEYVCYYFTKLFFLMAA